MSRTDVSDLTEYPTGHNLDPCEEGEHSIVRPSRGLTKCENCGLSLQTLVDHVGHDPRNARPSNRDDLEDGDPS